GAIAATAAQGTPAATPAGDTLTVTTSLGTYDIPANPQRVVAIDARIDLEIALVLGLPVVGTSLRAPNPWVPAPEDITIIDGPIELEQVAALQPDLIICADEDDEWWPTTALQRFAPVLPTSFLTYWKEDLVNVAGWMQRTGEMEDGFAEYDATIAATTTAYSDTIAATQVIYMQYIPDTATFSINTEGRLQPQVLNDLGGTLLGGTLPYTNEAEVSLERLGADFGEVDGILLQDGDGEMLAALSEIAIWNALPAVQKGNIVTSNGNINYGQIYTAREIARLWNELYAKVAASAE
ncbi:MAG: ABC transporter substrate-binding protein, partial [Thermomicrobiales bacterium]